MTRSDAMTGIVATLETLDESKQGWAPESYVYLPLSMGLKINLDDWQKLLGIMVDLGYVSRDGDTVVITDAGRAFSRKVTAERIAAKAQAPA